MTPEKKNFGDRLISRAEETRKYISDFWFKFAYITGAMIVTGVVVSGLQLYDVDVGETGTKLIFLAFAAFSYRMVERLVIGDSDGKD